MANLLVEEPDALMRARPGLWEPWWVTARATRPAASFIAWELTAVGTPLQVDGTIPEPKRVLCSDISEKVWQYGTVGCGVLIVLVTFRTSKSVRGHVLRPVVSSNECPDKLGSVFASTQVSTQQARHPWRACYAWVRSLESVDSAISGCASSSHRCSFVGQSRSSICGK